MPTSIYLVCQTTEPGLYAVLHLTVVLAQTLLGYRPHFDGIKKDDDQIYCIEYFDWTLLYVDDLLDVDTSEVDFEQECWFLHDGEPRTYPAVVSVSTVKVLDNGILWSASPKHTDGYVETPVLTWESLEEFLFSSHTFRKLNESIPESP